MKKKISSDKELDLADLGLRDVYSACYAFGFAFLSLAVGIALSCASVAYENLAAHLTFLIVGLCVSVFGIALMILGFLFLKKERNIKDGASLRCPIQSKKLLRNGYVVGGILCLIGLTTLTVGMLQFPKRPIHGVALLAGSVVALLYGMLLIVATIRDQLLANKASSLTETKD